MTTLTKTSSVIVIPGYAGTPGTAPRAAYSTTTYQTTYTYTYLFGIPQSNGTYLPASYNTPGAVLVAVLPATSGTIPVTTYYPAIPGTAPTPGWPASTTTQLNLGWNAGARSIASLPGNGGYQFTVPSNVIGLVAGFNTGTPAYLFAEVQHGLYFRKGLVSVVESGVSKNAAATFLTADVFKIVRIGSTVQYIKNGTVFYTSLVPSTGTVFLDTSIYSGGDAIVAAALTTFGSASNTLQLLTTVAGKKSNYANNALQPLVAGNTSGHISVGARVSLQSLMTLAGKKSAQVNVSLQPLAVNTAGRAYGARAVLQPLVAQASNRPYAAANTAFPALTVVTYGGQPGPASATSVNQLASMATAAHGLTGGITVNSAPRAMLPLTSMSSNKRYATSTPSLQALTSFSTYLPKINGYALLKVASKYTVVASGTLQPLNAFRGTARFSLSAYAGGFAKLNAPKISLMATGTGTIIGRATLLAPKITLSASGTAGSVSQAALKLTGTPKVVGYTGAVLSVRIGGQYKVVASGTQGSVGKAVMRLPLCKLVASGSLASTGSAKLTAPALRATPSGRALLLNPGFRLVAYGSAVVAASYEAYSVNLLTGLDRNPQNQYDPDVHEVTHYTNYPFTQIVRYNSSYYGVAADGLYLLEGDTDNGAPIGWSFRTALMDASSKQLKRVRSVYIGARLIAQATVTLVVGEQQDISYNYTTPRDNKAQSYRQQFGKGVRTRYFALELSDPAGNFIEIDTLDLENEILERAL